MPADQNAAAYYATAAYIAEYFDTALPTKPGLNLDTAIANCFASPADRAAIASSPSTPPRDRLQL